MKTYNCFINRMISIPLSPKTFECCNSDSDWIIILFFIHLDAFGVEKWRNQLNGTVFTSGTQFGKTESETFQNHFEASNDVFRGKTLLLKHSAFSYDSTHIVLSNDTRMASIGVCMQKLCHSEVDLPIFTTIN